MLGNGARVDELAAVAVGAEQLLVEGLARLRLVAGGDVLLLLQLGLSVSEGTFVTVFTRARFHPTFAKLGLQLEAIVFRNDSAVASERERIGSFLVLLDGPHELASLVAVLDHLFLELELVAERPEFGKPPELPTADESTD
eukprot:CAMPEP_0170482636 /NCGR_PEP_ID=MMETSP0208-20121228/2565_1 /TAXON_ID=197538 /ORGANISM="Strombidium inclinatum, Strain S3" /LENGTH=140 /DNA_ID=CAMNT_0010755493 /DNA_START=315 /DNA_END=738 /DNA_ORIENTATION=-